MSTYYSMVCDKHLERCHAVSRTAGSYCNLIDSGKTLQPFIIVHHSCPVRVVSEHEDDYYDERFTDWTKDNVKEMYCDKERDTEE